MLTDDLTRYVALHHALGFKFRIQAGLLRSFVAFAEAHGDDVVLAARSVEWASEAPSAPQRRNRLLTVRRFALAMHAEEPRHEVPAADTLGRASFKRKRPYIWSDDEIALLIDAALRLEPTGGIRPRMYWTLFGLLAATGLRISEALALRICDYTNDGLMVLATKFRKSRLVPIHDSTRRVLDDWLEFHPAGSDAPLFRSKMGTGPAYSTVITVYLKAARSIDLRAGPGKPGPRIHDLRHSFAVRSLERCGSDRSAVALHMAGLSTYLGHAHVTDTYWYLQATPTLMVAIAAAGEALHIGEPS